VNPTTEHDMPWSTCWMEDSDPAAQRIRRVTLVGLWTNVGLGTGKLVVGLLAGSMALVADGAHSFSDMLTDAVVLLGTHFGSKEPDTEHPFGHGRMETFAAMFVAAVLVGVGGLMIQQASRAIARINAGLDPAMHLGPLAVATAAISVVGKEALYRATRHVAVQTHSAALYANAWHHRSDALSSVAVLTGFAAMAFGYDYGDPVAAIAVGLMIILVAVKILGNGLNELAERAVDQKTIAQIHRILDAEPRIRDWHKLRTRTVGREVFLDVHILVEPHLTITEAHGIADALERALHEGVARPLNIMVHVEPDQSQSG